MPSKSPSSQISLITMYIFLLSSVANSAAKNGTRSVRFRKIYAFGDSFTDTGNTKTFAGPGPFQFVSNFPYGSTFFHYPTNRYSDGRLVIDFIAEAVPLPYLPPYLRANANNPHGINFAVAGATAIEHSFFVRNNVTLALTPQSLETQFGWFERVMRSQGCRNLLTTPRQCKAVFDEALIWVGEIGVNDYAYTLASLVPSETIRQLATERVTQFLKALLSKGAKYVVVQGLPPTGCLALAMQITAPFDRDDMGCARTVNVLSSTHNKILISRLKYLRKMFPNAIISYADYYNAYRYIIKHAHKYGFYQQFRACCGSGVDLYKVNILGLCGSVISTSCPNPAHYINWDGVHLTEAMHKALSQLFLRGGFISPSFEYLLAKPEKQIYEPKTV